jgi:hypothetical protein
MMRKHSSFLATCYHEAGHAYAAWTLNIRIKSVTVVPDSANDSFGAINRHSALSRRFRDVAAGLISDSTRLKAENEVMVSLAGMVAQKRFSPRSCRKFHGHYDTQNVIDVLSRFADEREMKAWHKLLLIKTENMLLNPIAWVGVTAIAQQLSTQNTLTSEDIDQTIRSANQSAIERKRLAARSRAFGAMNLERANGTL